MLKGCIKNCPIVELYYKVLIIQLLDKCLRGNKIAPLKGMHALLCSTLVPKGYNFIAPLTLMQQFFITLFSNHFRPLRNNPPPPPPSYCTFHHFAQIFCKTISIFYSKTKQQKIHQEKRFYKGAITKFGSSTLCLL